MQTNVPGIYAAGDVIGGWLLAHVAFAEGICAAENAFGLESRMDYRVVPRVVFSLPEYSAVGLSEEEAQVSSPIKVARFPFKSLGMGQAMGELEGLVKIISHAKTDQILGAHIIGPHAGDLICEIALAMKAEVPSLVIMQTIHSHPSLSEAVLEVAQALHGHAIHMLPGETASMTSYLHQQWLMAEVRQAKKGHSAEKVSLHRESARPPLTCLPSVRVLIAPTAMSVSLITRPLSSSWVISAPGAALSVL